MGTALAFGAMQVAPRPRTFDRLEPCVEDKGIVDWTPDVLHPVAAGFKDYGPPEAPLPMRLFYPTYQAFTEGGGAIRPLLKICSVRWPVVLFLHGRPPCDESGVTEAGYHLRWSRFATVLAKSGYVVALPSYEAPHPGDTDAATLARVTSVIDWVRGVRVDTTNPGAATARTADPILPRRWENADFVHPRATAIAGHSFGAVLAARAAQARPSISSFVSLGGPFRFLGDDAIPILESIQARKFFVWVDPSGSTHLESENLDRNGLWSGIPQPKHAGVILGDDHFDYIRLRLSSGVECGQFPGSCTAVQGVAPDLAALFIARHTPVGASPSIPLSLIPPNRDLTPRQRFFAGAHLSSFEQFQSQRSCHMTLRWETPGESGSRVIEEG
jgi:dienelactone hydrolase